uniref:Rab-GAP TBC domain-containing protein n=1 Tax=Oncorhynchus mykiss TaxID=8022 RepID=A0A8C7PP14_ONCMY
VLYCTVYHALSCVLFEHEGVFIHSNTEASEDQDLLVSGFLRIIDKDGEIIVEYKPLEDTVDPSNMLCAGKDSSSVMEWAYCPGEERSSPQQAVVLEQQQSYETEWDMINAVSFPKRKPCSNGEGALNHTHEKSKWSFTFSVWDLRSITVKEEGWSRLVFGMKEPPTLLPSLHFHLGGSEGFIDCLRRYIIITEAPDDETCLLVSTPNRALSQSFENLLDDNNYGLVTKLKKDPYVTTLGGFSKVTNYIFDAFRGPELEQQQRKPHEEVADLDILGLGEVIPGLEINQQEEPGFEVITRMDLGARPEVTRREPLSAEDWAKHQDQEGRVENVPQLKKIIFKGGLCHAVRKEAWKFLLGYYTWDSTYDERKGQQRRKTYKDVNRTDRTNRFYEGIDNPGLVLLHDVLMTYCMYDFDLGYVQGMSDLLSPILYVMDNEVDAFWCFVSFMDQMHQNFEEPMQGMKTQLIQLSTLLRLLDLAFWNYLESQDSGYLYFCFRWLLIRFKRELSYPDVLRLWEVMWTGLPCQNFHLLVCCAILDSEKRKIMEENYGFNEILKHINELSMKLDIEEILHKSEAICMQIRSCKDLPYSVSEILGFNTESKFPRLEGREFGTLDSPRPTQRQEVFSNGHNRHYREPPTHNGCKVSFIS